MKIDAHQHFWHPARGDYPWMPDDDPVLTRPYHPEDMRAALFATGVEKTILVQAAPTVAETDYLLGVGDSADFVGGVVGWVDFERAKDRDTLDRFAGHPLFKGVRPMIQDIPDPDWMLREDIAWAYEAVVALDLTFDALGYPQHLDNFLTIFTRYPDMRVVVDHCMKPAIRNHSPERFEQWATGIARIASETGTYCKLSGLITEAAENWSVEDLRPYANHVLDVFGPTRVMWGSDWPVARLRAEYDRWHSAAEKLAETLSADEKADVFGGTAARFYRIAD